MTTYPATSSERSCLSLYYTYACYAYTHGNARVEKEKKERKMGKPVGQDEVKGRRVFYAVLS